MAAAKDIAIEKELQNAIKYQAKLQESFMETEAALNKLKKRKELLKQELLKNNEIKQEIKENDNIFPLLTKSNFNNFVYNSAAMHMSYFNHAKLKKNSLCFFKMRKNLLRKFPDKIDNALPFICQFYWSDPNKHESMEQSFSFFYKDIIDVI